MNTSTRGIAELLMISSKLQNSKRRMMMAPPTRLCARRSVGTTTFNQNPYRVLDVPINSDYETVKRAFLKSAMEHHPDRKGDASKFIQIRHAFEEIVYSGSNNAKNDNVDVYKSEEEFQEWFQAATDEFLTFEMNQETRKEVIHVFKTMSHGGKDKGGYWEMARQLAEREEAAGDSARMDFGGQLEAGNTSTQLNHRRRRKR